MIKKSDKILFVSWTVPPVPTGSAIVMNNVLALNTEKQFNIFGEKPLVGDLADNVIYFQLHFHSTGRGRRFYKWFSYFKLLKEIKKNIQDNKVTKLILVYPDLFFLLAGVQAAKELKIDYYPWMHNTMLENHGLKFPKMYAYLQSYIFKNAKQVFTISDTLTDFYNNNYPQLLVKTLCHGFRIPPSNPKICMKTDGIKFLLTGSLNESNEAITILVCKAIIANPAFQLHIHSGNTEEYFTQRGIVGTGVHYHGFIRADELENSIQEYDFFLLCHGYSGKLSSTEINTIIPTRLAMYLYAGLPLIAFVENQTGLYNYLHRNDCSLLLTKEDIYVFDVSVQNLITKPERQVQILENARRSALDFSAAKFLDSLYEA